MAISNRVMTAALFAERVVPIAAKVEQVNPDYASPAHCLEQALRKAGINPLGTGHYGAVLKIPGTDDVLKVCTSDKDGYPTYAQWAQNNQGPGIPEIFWSIRINESLFMCAMPAYKELTNEDGERVRSLRDQGENLAEPASYLGKAVAEVCKELGRFARKDMHTGNFMYCPRRGEYIITNPFANLMVAQDEAEGYATGKPRVAQMREQNELDFGAPRTVGDRVASIFRQDKPRPAGMFALGADPFAFPIAFADMEVRAADRFRVQGVQLQNMPRMRKPSAARLSQVNRDFCAELAAQNAVPQNFAFARSIFRRSQMFKIGVDHAHIRV